MKIKCISCEWEWNSAIDEEVRSWEECPNCDFPYKFTEWIEQMQSEIAELKREIERAKNDNRLR